MREEMIPMTDAELVLEAKKGLNLPLAGTAFDGVLFQKILAVKAYMKNAGVSDEAMNGDLAVGVIVMGVVDLWSLGGGEVKFSPAFHLLLTQMAVKSGTLGVSSNPPDGAQGIPVTVRPVLTFSRGLKTYTVRLKTYNAQTDFPCAAVLDITGKMVTVTPASNLVAATKYALVVEAVSIDGPGVDRAVIGFTTA